MNPWKPLFICLIAILGWEGLQASFETAPREVSLSKHGVTVQGERCPAIGGDPAHALASCGLSPRERETALEKLLARESKRKVSLQREMEEMRPRDKDVLWVARAVYVEGRSLPAYGQELLAHALVNRMESRHWPNTAKSVVLQADQITGMDKQDHIWPQLTMADYPGGDTEWRVSVRAAWEALSMPDSLRPMENVYHWYTPELLDSKPHWAAGKTPIASVHGTRASIQFIPGTLRRNPPNRSSAR